MRRFNVCTIAASAAAIAGAIITSSGATASPPSNVQVENLALGDFNKDEQVNHDDIKFQTKNPTDLRVQRLTFAGGGTTGWHHHPGLVLVMVQSGTLTVWHTDCSQEVYGPGTANGNVFVEGDDRAHQAVSDGGATVYATYVLPNGAGPRVEEPVPFCAQPH